jgi:hypothetical protein
VTELTTTTLGRQHASPGEMRTLAVGASGGLALGIVARAWMRLIAEEPDFTWNGTLFIVLGFTVFGLTESTVTLARRRGGRPSTLAAARVLGVIGMLPLFGAAGALMVPTVIGGGLAVARVDWPRVTRGICLVVAAGPVLLVANDLVSSFGWSLRTAAGFVGLLVVYATIIRTARLTFTPATGGIRLPRWARVLIPLVAVAVVIVALAAGGIQ